MCEASLEVMSDKWISVRDCRDSGEIYTNLFPLHDFWWQMLLFKSTKLLKYSYSQLLYFTDLPL